MTAEGVLPDTFDDLELGVLLHDPETGAIVDANDAMEGIYGYAPEALTGMAVETFSADTAEFSEAAAIERIRAAADGETQMFQWHGKRSNGELVWVDVRLSSVEHDRRYVMAEIRDVTEFKERERRLNLLYRVLRHNLRNEMTIILGYADQLEAAVEEERLEQRAETIRETAKEVAALRESVAQIETIAERDATTRVPTNVADLAEDAVASLRETYPTADIGLEVTADPWVNADRGLHAALDHLLENGVVHNDSETPTVRVSVTDAGNRAVVSVADDGPRIPEMEVSALDDLRETTQTAHGSGVGLWVVKWCVESLGGEIEFEDNEPRGNVVRLRLPQCDPPQVDGGVGRDGPE